LVNSTIPVLSETLINALVIMILLIHSNEFILFVND
jgi:hypothetical protein